MLPKKIRAFRDSLKRNNTISILCLLSVLTCFVLNSLERREAQRERAEYAYYVAADGEVIPAHYAARRDNIEIEIRHHLAMFVDAWYNLTQYDWEEKAERAGWLGGNSIRDLFIARKKAGYYNRFIQNNITQAARIVDLQVHPGTEPIRSNSWSTFRSGWMLTFGCGVCWPAERFGSSSAVGRTIRTDCGSSLIWKRKSWR